MKYDNVSVLPVMTICKSGYEKKDGFCISKEEQTKGCHTGDYYFSDDTCAPDFVEGKYPLGVVVDEKSRLVLSTIHDSAADSSDAYGKPLSSYNLGDNNLNDAPDITLTPKKTQEEALADMDGRANTKWIINHLGDNVGAIAYAAATCVHNYGDGKSWFLPSLGQLNLVTSDMREAMDKVMRSY